ncbi:hypothetical protein JOM56_005151 [Amanita muscaria]
MSFVLMIAHRQNFVAAVMLKMQGRYFEGSQLNIQSLLMVDVVTSQSMGHVEAKNPLSSVWHYDRHSPPHHSHDRSLVAPSSRFDFVALRSLLRLSLSSQWILGIDL